MAENRVELSRTTHLILYAEQLGSAYSLIVASILGDSEAAITSTHTDPEKTEMFDYQAIQTMLMILRFDIPDLTEVELRGLFTNASRNYAQLLLDRRVS